MGKLKLKTVPLQEIKLADYNPRIDLQSGDPEYEKLKNSILQFGYIDPIIWNERSGNIVGGHQRFKVLVDLGYEEFEVVPVDYSPEVERACNLALNKISGDFVEEKVADLLHYLQENDFELTYTGFDPEEVFDLLSTYYDEQPVTDEDLEDFDPDQEAEMILEPYTKAGDIWKLGPHRLGVGDSLDAAFWEQLMDGNQADMVFTDPPYNVNYTGGTKDKLKIQNDHMGDSQFHAFLLAAFERLLEVTKKGGAIYVSHADSEGLNFRSAFIQAGWDLKQCLIWVKNALNIGRQDYQWQHEPILYGWKPGATHNWYGDRDKSTVIDSMPRLRDLDRAELISLINELCNADQTTVFRTKKPNTSDDHPTMKPLDLMRHYIKNSSKRGEIVVDSFLGSGSTLISAAQLDRLCYGMELDERYAQVVVERYKSFTDQHEDISVLRNNEEIPYAQIMKDRGD